MARKNESVYDPICESQDAGALKRSIQRHITSSLGSDYTRSGPFAHYRALALTVRDHMVDQWIRTQRSFYEKQAKRVYYLSMEFLPGRSLINNLINLGLEDESRKALDEMGYTLEEIEEMEWDAGLGNGGLGRLASCYLDSMASLKVPGYGYGIRYDYGIFYQVIRDGYQVERIDNWMRFGDCWSFERPEHMYLVKYYGRVEQYRDEEGRTRQRWVDTDNIMAIPCDGLIPGYRNDNVINMRLWAAKPSREFNLETFNLGDYLGAVEDKIKSETISKVLYPREDVFEGRMLRLKQQYFFVAATFQDIMRRFKKREEDFSLFPDRVAIQLNDTHPAIAVPELMRLLLDEEGLDWDLAWDITTRSIAYTNHTLLPEALETWPVAMMGELLPRHMQIIYDINYRFLEYVARVYPGDKDKLRDLSIIQEEPEKRVRMAHLAIVGSRKVNGVSKLHSDILVERVFKDFNRLYPGKFINVTNGITPRRWLRQTNPGLAGLITEAVGEKWLTDLTRLKELVPLAEDAGFREKWRSIKAKNKEFLSDYILAKNLVRVSTKTMFDVHTKRIHEYKRQVLNALHCIVLYNRIKQDPGSVSVARTKLFSGKAAPGYMAAKTIVKLINSVAETVNHDPQIGDMLKVVFMANYCVSKAQKIIGATELSEQISTAGLEASGTGNMKFALNGALTIGTLDGANIEIKQEVGDENIFIFGLTAKEVEETRPAYNPRQYYESDPELKTALDMIRAGAFTPNEPNLFHNLVDSLLNYDQYMVLADFRSYVDCPDEVDKIYTDPEKWTRRSILNTANIGFFSSDRAVAEYAEKIWRIKPLEGGPGPARA